jgi:hypothetical protein
VNQFGARGDTFHFAACDDLSTAAPSCGEK